MERLLGPLAAKWSFVATALAVQQRFQSVKGNYLAAAVTLNLFTSLLPALVVVVAVIGFFTNNSDGFVDKIIETLGLTGDTADTMIQALDDAAERRREASIIGFLSLVWTGLGLVAAIEYALDATWQHTGRNIKDKLRGIVWGAGAFSILAVSIALTTAVDVVAEGVFLVVISAVVATAINIGLWLWTFSYLSYDKLPWKAHISGAIMAGVALEVIKQAASLFGKSLGGSALVSSLAAAFAILGILLILGRVLIYSSILNVVKWEQHYGTVTVDIEVPRVPGEVPVETDRAGAVDPTNDSS